MVDYEELLSVQVALTVDQLCWTYLPLPQSHLSCRDLNSLLCATTSVVGCSKSYLQSELYISGVKPWLLEFRRNHQDYGS